MVFSLMYGRQVVRDQLIVVTGLLALFPRANSLDAASIWRMLLMQALACEVARAFTKFGIAMAASKPDDGYNNHDFNQGETRFTDVFIRFHFTCSLYLRRECTTGGLLI